jgi:hypothetical protein
MERQNIRVDVLLASHVWEPLPTTRWGLSEAIFRSTPVWRMSIGHQKDIHDTTCISSGESMQEEQSIGIYYILKGKKCQHCNQCREFILAQIVWEYGVGITVEVMA